MVHGSLGLGLVGRVHEALGTQDSDPVSRSRTNVHDAFAVSVVVELPPARHTHTNVR